MPKRTKLLICHCLGIVAKKYIKQNGNKCPVSWCGRDISDMREWKDEMIKEMALIYYPFNV